MAKGVELHKTEEAVWTNCPACKMLAESGLDTYFGSKLDKTPLTSEQKKDMAPYPAYCARHAILV